MATFSEFANLNQNGISIVAVRAEPEDVAKILETLDDTVAYQRSPAIGEVVFDDKQGVYSYPDGRRISITAYRDRRTAFLSRTAGCHWCLLFRTLEWVEPADIDWIYDAAKLLSESLGAEAIAVCGSWMCDGRHYDHGKVVKKFSGADPDKIAAHFDERAIDLPICLIADDPPRLLATPNDAKQIDVVHELQQSVDSS